MAVDAARLDFRSILKRCRILVASVSLSLFPSPFLHPSFSLYPSLSLSYLFPLERPIPSTYASLGLVADFHHVAVRWWSNFYHGASNSLECTNLHGYGFMATYISSSVGVQHRGSNKSISWNILLLFSIGLREKEKWKINGFEERDVDVIDNGIAYDACLGHFFFFKFYIITKQERYIPSDRVIYFLWYFRFNRRFLPDKQRFFVAPTFKLPAAVFLSTLRVSKFPLEQDVVHRVLIYIREISFVDRFKQMQKLIYKKIG